MNVLAIGTRFHLGNASNPPSEKDLKKKVSSFVNTLSKAKESGTFTEIKAAIAVESSQKFDSFDFPAEVDRILSYTLQECDVNVEILPVSPWGNFLPALNSLLLWSAKSSPTADQIMFVSAEMSVPGPESFRILQDQIKDDTLVVGAALPGHNFTFDNSCSQKTVELTGRTTPWNTMAIWNVSKLSTTGFPMVGEGVHVESDKKTFIAGGVEEVSAIALIQNFMKDNAVAKLINIPGIAWEQSFEDDERRAWHQRKMESKESRPARHLSILGLSGTVLHISDCNI